MRVLVTGATGLIGSALVEALIARGHTPVPAVRDIGVARLRWPRLQPVRVDFTRDHATDDWRPRLDGLDAVVNAVGILRERGAQTFEALHVRAPVALFDACIEAGVARVVQISALGADTQATSGYHASKRMADAHLLSLPLQACVLQPSLVFAPHGASAGALLAAASLPLIPLPGDGDQPIAPVYLDDVCAAVIAALEAAQPPPCVAVVGPQCISLRHYLALLRAGIGLGRARFVPMPMPLVRAASRLLARLPGSLADPETVAMLERGNCAGADALTRLLGRAPRPVTAFVTAHGAATSRRQARLRWLLPVLRVSIALMWIVTAIVSFGVYPIEASHALLARTGLTGTPADIALYGAAALDLALGIALLLPINRRPVYLVQIVLIAGYTAIITVALPEYWAHPYGPVLKNLPILAALWLLLETDRRE
jgi:uncharacterized protein YbjT (DUF2867 family)/uncharacterized membrane protein YphA (DoxX/SURF4 family)